jgi:predicted Zn-dependent peptidase
VDEPLNTAETRITQSDALAQVPAVAIGYKIAERGSKDQAPMAVLADVLAGGDASRLYQGLVKGKTMALNIDSLFGLTGPFEYDGPTLLTLFALYKPDVKVEDVLAEMDAQIAQIVKDGVSDAELARVKTAMLADWNNSLESFLSRADTLAKYQALWGDAKVANQVPGWIQAVTSDDLKRVAAKYLTVANRTVIDRKPAAMLATDAEKK